MQVASRDVWPMMTALKPEQGVKAGSAQPRVEPCPREPEHTGGKSDLVGEERRVEPRTTKNVTVVGAETET